MKKTYLVATFFAIAFVALINQIFLDQQYQINVLRERAQISPTPTPTEIPWVKYQNEVFGFEFQYPFRNSFFPDVSVEQTKLSYDAIIRDFNSPKYPKSKKCTPGGKCIIYEDITKETYHEVGGVKINRFTYAGMESDITELYFSYLNKNYLINLGLFMEDDQIVNRVISTIKFTDSTFCGGIAGIKCPNGRVCKLDGKYPDAGGVCVN